ncbi:cytochrome-c peroxidase [Psychroserpens sp. XS_ASV72]|uniref:cytochrome-c peroxidase n=1 Tax=Psychroserpens sp. XS_ASV72 TaxID=3241293 RepID=UPI003514D52F
MKSTILILIGLLIFSCGSDNNNDYTPIPEEQTIDFSNILTIDFDNLHNYSNQSIPNYIIKDNTTPGNEITNEVATLGRILFYDKNLSADNTIACASCHKQSLAFTDNVQASSGINGLTSRHSMRLVNARFGVEAKFFWDERAINLETQTTMPIQDHVEMGFSGENGDENFNDLIAKLELTEYYPALFNFAFGSEDITELRIQNALAQFVRSIQSFDSKYDVGRALANNDGQPFTNFSPQENQGKQLFLQPPVYNNQGVRINGGLGCAGCHQAPEFDIDPNSLNNGMIGSIASNIPDLNVTRSPSLRDVVKADGSANGLFMHNGSLTTLDQVLEHYNSISLTNNSNIDPRLSPGGEGQNLNLTEDEKQAVIAFLQTLGGTDVYTNEKWSNPFIQ